MREKGKMVSALVLAVLALFGSAHQVAGQDGISGADTSWLLVSMSLVLLMTPGLALFYGGLVNARNALNTMMMSFVALGAVGVAWAVAGYSLAFGEGSALAGDLSMAFLRGVGLDANGSIPHLLFMGFQGTFAIITAALISGALIGRMRFGPYVAFIVLWGLAVYAPVAHWVWGGGWLSGMGALDFAGGAVVHVNAGAAAFAAALVLGKRNTYGGKRFSPQRALRPHRRWTPLVRVVRLQWGERARGRRDRRARLGEHASRAGRHARRMGASRPLPLRHRDGRRDRHGDRGRARGRHACRRIRLPHVGSHHRRGRRAAELFHAAVAARGPLLTTRSTSLRPTGWAG